MSDNPFVGVWKLISCEALRRNGNVLPVYGRNPVGRLYYDAAGNMSVHIMRAGRPNFAETTKFRAMPQEMRAAYEGYEAYFSYYEFDEEQRVIRHAVIGGLFPNWTGTVQTRYYRFDGNRLILSTEPFDGASPDRTIVILVWERVC